MASSKTGLYRKKHYFYRDGWQPGWFTSRCVLSTVFYIVYLLVPIIALVHVAGIKWKFCVGLGLGLLFKGTVSRNFRPLLCLLQTFYRGPYEQAKQFREDIRENFLPVHTGTPR